MTISRFCISLFYYQLPWSAVDSLQLLGRPQAHTSTGEFWGRTAGPPAEQNWHEHPQRLPGCQLARWDIKSEACSPVLGFVFSFLIELFVLVFPSCFLLYRRSRHQVPEADFPPGEQGGGPNISHQHGWNVRHLKVPTRLPAFTVCLACLHVDSSAAAGCTSVYCPAASLWQNSWQRHGDGEP